jgi:hypothetical protein
MTLITTKFNSGGLHEKQVVETWKGWEPCQHSLLDPGKPKKKKKTCVEEAGRRTFKILTSSQQSGI